MTKNKVIKCKISVFSLSHNMKENSFITCRLQHVITLRSVDALFTFVLVNTTKE